MTNGKMTSGEVKKTVEIAKENVLMAVSAMDALERNGAILKTYGERADERVKAVCESLHESWGAMSALLSEMNNNNFSK